eukprot:365011-Chlamydomonas_euryale.AAC.7
MHALKARSRYLGDAVTLMCAWSCRFLLSMVIHRRQCSYACGAAHVLMGKLHARTPACLHAYIRQLHFTQEQTTAINFITRGTVSTNSSISGAKDVGCSREVVSWLDKEVSYVGQWQMG